MEVVIGRRGLILGVLATAAAGKAASNAGLFDPPVSNRAACYLTRDDAGNVDGAIVKDTATGRGIFELKGTPDSDGIIQGEPTRLNGATGRDKGMTVDTNAGQCDYFDGTSGETIRYNIREGNGIQAKAGVAAPGLRNA